VRRSEFEDILISQTPYYKSLEKIYRDSMNFNRSLGILRKICKEDSVLDILGQRGGKELVYLGRKIFSLQEEFILNYLEFLKDESNIKKWEEFFERYSNNIFQIYERFISGDRGRVIIFEIVNRKLLRDFLTKHTTDIQVENKILVAERFGMVVNQLFNYIRNSLARNMVIPDNLIVESYGKIPLLPKCSRSESLKLLSKYFLQKGLPEQLFTAIFKTVTALYYNEEKQKVIDAINRQEFTSKENISEILNSHFFIPDEQSLEEILIIIKAKAHKLIADLKEKKEAAEKKTSEIKKKIKETTDTLSKELVNITSDFSTEESLDNIVKNLRRNLLSFGYSLQNLRKDYREFIKQENELINILGIKTNDLMKFISKNEWDPFLLLLLNRREVDDENLQLIIKEVINEVKNDKVGMGIMNSLRSPGFLKEKYNTQEINKRFFTIVNEIILPLVKSLLLEELIDYYPKLLDVVTPESIRYLAEESIAGNVSIVEKDVKVMYKTELPPQLNILRYKDLVAVLVYDIRGSTFMGTKLQDAKKESEIKNLFQESMLTMVEKNGGVPIKDTGDGGLVLFAENSYEIKNQSVKELKPGSVLSAVRCGLDMLKESKNFVEENIKKYQDWFHKAEERKINFEGDTYATLPPSYQSIFQIGIGIASGEYPKEVYVSENAFKEFDLTGMLVREANFYSKVRAKEKSTLICDDATVYNLLLNVNKFSFLSDTGLKIDPLLIDIEQGLEYWINQKISRHGFIFDLYKIFVSELGQEVVHPGSLKILLGIFDIKIDETGEIKDGKGGRGKFLFEISQEGVK